MRFVEFSGIPGSGKSSILPVVARYLRRNGRDVVDRDNLIHRVNSFPFNSKCFQTLLSVVPRVLRNRCTEGLNNYLYLSYEYQLKYMVNHLPVLRHVLATIDDRPIPEMHKAMLVRWFFKMAGSYEMARECLSEDSVFLCDEGYVQKVVSLYISVDEESPEPVDVKRYLDQVPGEMVLVHVTAEPESCKRRIVARALPRRLRGRTDHEIDDFLRKSKEVTDMATSHMLSRGGQVVVVNNSHEPFAEGEIEQQLSSLQLTRLVAN